MSLSVKLHSSLIRTGKFSLRLAVLTFKKWDFLISILNLCDERVTLAEVTISQDKQVNGNTRLLSSKLSIWYLRNNFYVISIIEWPRGGEELQFLRKNESKIWNI